MIYFDNSSSTFYKPREVISSVVAALKFLPVNAGRSGHDLAIKAAGALNRTRENAASFFGATPERTIFTYGCTDSLNIALFGTAVHGGHVVTTAFEHNSVLRPLFRLKEDGVIDLTVVYPRSGKILASDVLNAIRRNTYLVAMNCVSNVTGYALPVEEVGKELRSTKIAMLADGAQSAGYRKFDYSLFDMYAVAPHKGLHAPQGIGLLTLSERVQIVPTRLGGTGTVSQSTIQPLDLPEALESGTLPLPNILALNAAICHAIRFGDEEFKRISMLGKYLLGRIKDIDGVTVYTDDPTAGIIAFNIDGLSSGECANRLNEYGFCVRSGLHCAPLLHRSFGTLNVGMVRASLGFDNTFTQIDLFLEAVEEISNEQKTSGPRN